MSQDVVGIIGLGPVGTIIGAFLAKSGVTVYGMDTSEERVEQINSNGLVVRGFTDLDVLIERCYSKISQLAEVKDLAALFVCTKTWAIDPVMNAINMCRWPENMRVIAFMNGVGPEDTIGELIDKSKVSRGVANFAGNITDDGDVTMNWFNPPNLIGPATERKAEWTPHISDILTASGLITESVDHLSMKKAAFFKTVLNSALNALCAAHGLTMGHAMRLHHTRAKAKVLLREALTVAALVGYNYGENALGDCMRYLGAGGDHYPSMWFDLKNRRPTEIEYINGKVVKIGKMFKNIDVDLNLYFTSAIITQEIKNGTRDENDIPDYLAFD